MNTIGSAISTRTKRGDCLAIGSRLSLSLLSHVDVASIANILPAAFVYANFAGSWGNWMTLFEYGELREDCEVDENGVRHCYGYRNDQSPTDRYLLDGCIYQNLDIPGQGGINDAFDRVGPDFKVEVDIHCRLLLSIIDTGDNTVVHSQTLDFSCREKLLHRWLAVAPAQIGDRTNSADRDVFLGSFGEGGRSWRASFYLCSCLRRHHLPCQLNQTAVHKLGRHQDATDSGR